MINRFYKFINDFSQLKAKINFLYDRHGQYDLKSPKFLIGKLLSSFNANKVLTRLEEMEFQVFSQFGDDGIIQYLVSKLSIEHKTFVEFGIENYTESNTRFLLINNNWSGLVIDGSQASIKYVKEDPVSLMHDLHSKCSFVTKDNINTLLSDFLAKGYKKNIGLLSIDIDGNDYWVWKAITAVEPTIVIIEYNSVFGSSNSWTIPYEENFNRLNSHNSHQYWGASLGALIDLGKSKGYSFIGCNSAGNNAYFLKNEFIGYFKEISVSDGFVESKFREDIDAHGDRIDINKRLNLIKGMSIYNVANSAIEIIN